MKLLVGLSKCIVTAPDCCASESTNGLVGFSKKVTHLDPGHLLVGYLQVVILSHDRNEWPPSATTLLSGSRSVYDVKSLTCISSCPLLSRSNTEKTNRGSVTAFPVVESTNANVRLTCVPDWIDSAPNRPLHPP